MKELYKVIITEYNNSFLLLYICDKKTIEIKVINKISEYNVGDIYLGEIIKKKDNINSSFVNVSKELTLYLKGTEYKGGSLVPIMINKRSIGNKQNIGTDKLSIAGIYNVCFENKSIRRTNASFSSEENSDIELKYLSEKLDAIKSFGLTRTKGSKLFETEHELISTVYSYRFDMLDEIITDSEYAYEIFSEFINKYKSLGIYLKPELKKYNDDMISLSSLYSIKSRLDDATSKKVWLKSNAYLYIEHTEAMTIIDVNSGSTVFKGKKDDVALQINKESFDEILEQFRLRNLSGIIVVDFINMKNKSYNDELIEYINIKIKNDNRKAKCYGMTSLGLVEFTRDRVDLPLYQLLKTN